MLLHRFAIKPHHLDAYLGLWPEEVALRRRHGFAVHRAFVETDAEPKFTWLYSCDSPAAEKRATEHLVHDPQFVDLQGRMAPHVFRNATIRPVEVEMMTPEGDMSQLAVMRRYSITGSWDEFLGIWRRIVPVRATYGYPCLFAVTDRPTNTFTWAFGFDGEWADFPASQRDYYHDPDRVLLRSVFDYMADYALHPARQLPIPSQ